MIIPSQDGNPKNPSLQVSQFLPSTFSLHSQSPESWLQVKLLLPLSLQVQALQSGYPKKLTSHSSQSGKFLYPSWHWSHLSPVICSLQVHFPFSLQSRPSEPSGWHPQDWQVGNPKNSSLQWSQDSPSIFSLHWHCPTSLHPLEPSELHSQFPVGSVVIYQ